MNTPTEDQALVQSILIHAEQSLGAGEKMLSLGIQYSATSQQGVVHAELITNTFETQKEAVESFFAVQDIFSDEAELVLRFGRLNLEQSDRVSVSNKIFAAR